MTEIVKRLTVERTRHATLEALLRQKGFYSDYGWENLLKRWNKLSPTKPREIELVYFRPTEEEYGNFFKTEPPVYHNRKLLPASLFEVLAAIPGANNQTARKEFCAELGSNFILFVHGHYTTSGMARGFPSVEGRWGWNLDFGTNILTSRKSCWYVGFRKVKK